MEQKWFEMSEVRKRSLANAVWIPLRAVRIVSKSGEYGFEGYHEEFHGVGSVAIPLSHKLAALDLGWEDVGINQNHVGWVDGSEYVPADDFRGYDSDVVGEHLVLSQHFNAEELNEWHLSQDLVVTLGLKREGDEWLRPAEGYHVVAKLGRSGEGEPNLLEIRATHLRDYLAARQMGLYVTAYHSRVQIAASHDHVKWDANAGIRGPKGDQWDGRIQAIHEGGMLYGGTVAVHHMSRTDVDPEDDVPSMGLATDENVRSKNWVRTPEGRKLYRIHGELWRNEWVDPATSSPIVRRDELPATVFFITDSDGNEESKETLIGGEGRWLWFRPEAINALLAFRGSCLRWYTRDTGAIGCTPETGVHFGINQLGLINVYAKDIGLLPDWQQKVWAGFNVGPDGKVSAELLNSQVEATPARTQAPEALLGDVLAELGRISAHLYGEPFLKPHERTADILNRAHRFRATDLSGLFGLAKDLARLTADGLDITAIQKVVKPPAGANWGSLKSLGAVVAAKIGAEPARKIMGPLFKVYELRLADAHLPSNEFEEAFSFLNIDRRQPFPVQGLQLLNACVSCIVGICHALLAETAKA